MITDFIKNFNFSELKYKIKDIKIPFLNQVLEFDDILILAILIFLIYQDNDDYILFIILILLVLE